MLPEDSEAARQFIQGHFTPRAVTASNGSRDGVFTGYYEPEIAASRARSGRYTIPIYGKPADLAQPYFTRAEIDAGAIANAAPVLAWTDDAVELFFLQVQGSGILRFADGTRQRIGYAANNGRPYKAIGKTLVERKALDASAVTAPAIKAWLRSHPDQVTEVLESDPRYIFFKPASGEGPTGSSGRQLVPGVSLAVDPASIPLGSLVFVDSSGTRPFSGLMIADDTGAAIKGSVRGDVFLGSGPEAEARAGVMKNPGRCWIFAPLER